MVHGVRLQLSDSICLTNPAQKESFTTWFASLTQKIERVRRPGPQVTEH